MNTTTVYALNHEQQAAVDSDAPRRLVLASPGSGKTRTLCAAVAREAMLHGAAGCVVLSYTNNAALELQERLAAIGVTGLGACCTLHSFLFRMLCECSGTDVGVIDNEQRENFVVSIMEDLGVKAPLKHVMEAIEHDEIMPSNPDKVQMVVLEYRSRLRNSGLVDFNEILVRGIAAVEMLHADGRWPYASVFGDEIQDASQIDWTFYSSAPFKRRFIVGDDRQAIYSFRGGRQDILVKMADLASNPKATKEPKWELHTIALNYRSGVAICETANRLISHNKNQHGCDMVSASGFKNDVVCHKCATPAEELSFVLEEIQRDYHMGDLDGTDPRSFAVLARTNALARTFAEHLAANGIPVATVERPQRPSDWREAKLLLTVLANPFSDAAVLQLIRASEGDREAKLLREAAAVKMVGVNELLKWKYGKGDATIDADLGRHGLSSESRQLIHDAARELGRRGEWTLNDLIVYIGEQEQLGCKVGTGVLCTTIHSSKGTEFDVVIVVGCEEGTMPSVKDCATPELEAESRRLMFVAITRARHRLVLTWCEQRPQFRGLNVGPGPMQDRQPSRFLREMGLLPASAAVRAQLPGGAA